MALKAGCNLLRLEVISSLMTFLELFAEQIYRFVLELRYLCFLKCLNTCIYCMCLLCSKCIAGKVLDVLHDLQLVVCSLLTGSHNLAGNLRTKRIVGPSSKSDISSSYFHIPKFWCRMRQWYLLPDGGNNFIFGM